MKDETVKKKTNSLRESEYMHPSFGSITLSKINCRNQSLFGSSLKHDTMIALEIKEGTLSRRFHEDKYSGAGGKTIVEVMLSPLQFSEILTTMNQAEGIPCTIEHRADYNNGQSIKYPEEFAHKDKLQEYLDEYGDVTKDLQRFIKPHLDQVISNLDTNKSLGKIAQQQLLRDLQTVLSHLGSNSKFFMKQFEGYMGKTVGEAKAVIDSHIDTVIRHTGIEALTNMKNNMLQIGEIKDGL